MGFKKSTVEGSTITYTTNLNTGVQYKWEGADWDTILGMNMEKKF